LSSVPRLSIWVCASASRARDSPSRSCSPDLAAQLRHLFVQKREPALVGLRHRLHLGQPLARDRQERGALLGLGQALLGQRLGLVAGAVGGGQQGQRLLGAGAFGLQRQGHRGQFGVGLG
jgi:hypothetical protein